MIESLNMKVEKRKFIMENEPEDKKVYMNIYHLVKISYRQKKFDEKMSLEKWDKGYFTSLDGAYAEQLRLENKTRYGSDSFCTIEKIPLYKNNRRL